MDPYENHFLLANINHDNEDNICEENASECYNYDSSPSSPKLIKININKPWLEEINAFFKLNNLFDCIRNDEKKEPKRDISISKIIMDNIIYKKLGSVTYHHTNGKSSKAYYTNDYPEIYYNKKLYNNISHWLSEEFSKKI
jgi:hypothetical protein